ncbi:hypothetical protein BX666DRAFT_1899905 [Dichotomocladium elegans]|nr:hypothetical protein BX666DRAFT_1899905 [Dichotomocladium elegans]
MPAEKVPISSSELASTVLQPVSPRQQPSQPVKVRKKPGRKPNPASPALRKAQNRAAQRAFRERKERHLREMELAVKQIREQRDRLQAENDRLKKDSDILASENWYLKGIVLSLQLVCFRHNLVIPEHSPYINEEALGILAQSIPQQFSRVAMSHESSVTDAYRQDLSSSQRTVSIKSINTRRLGVSSRNVIAPTG